MTTATATATASPSRARQVGTVAALVTGIALLTKVALIVATNNGINESITGVLYIVGVALPLVAAVGIAAGRSPWGKRVAVYVGVIFAHLFFITMLSDGVGALVEVFTDEAYLADEIPVAVLGAVWLAVGLRMRSAREG